VRYMTVPPNWLMGKQDCWTNEPHTLLLRAVFVWLGQPHPARLLNNTGGSSINKILLSNQIDRFIL
jgi:hypothetical protein